MKTKLFIITILSIWAICSMPVFAQETDSTQLDLGQGWTARLDAIPFGTIIQTTSFSDALLEAKPFLGSGLGFSVLRNRRYGFNFSLLFYSGEEKKVFPMLALGPVLMLSEKVSCSLALDFGKTDENLNNWFAKRLRVLVSYNLKLLD